MYNKVIAFNVGCGDCSILQDERNGMLIDYGGKATKVSNVLLDVKRILSQCIEKNLMVSHLHKDHYCGIVKLANSVTFKHIYLPDYICGDGLYILASSLLVKTDSIIKQVKQILSIPKIFFSNGLINYNSDIRLLVGGDTFVNSLGEFEVLLPNVHKSSLPRSLLDKIYNNKIIKTFVEMYRKFLKDLIEFRNFDKFNENYEIIENYIEFDFDEATELFNQNEINNIKKEFKNYHNNLSIVFQNKECSNKNVLFCGDAISSAISSINHKLYNEYAVIKIPHHGTGSKYYFNNFPISNNFLIFNDYGANCSKISCQYDNKYGLRTRFFCTNKHCVKIEHKCFCSTVNFNNAICGFNNNYEIINI